MVIATLLASTASTPVWGKLADLFSKKLLLQVAMISPRERGRYSGLLGGVFALGTVAGPLIGGLLVDTSWLGWRWCFYVGVPFAAVALVLLQRTLHLPVTKRKVSIDYLGAATPRPTSTSSWPTRSDRSAAPLDPRLARCR